MAVKVKRQYLVDNTGRKPAVVVSLNDFEELMEDLHDLAVIAERRSEKTIGIDEKYRARLLPRCRSSQ